MADLNGLTEAIKAGDREAADQQTRAAIDAGTDAQSILDALTAGMDDVGRRFKANELYVPNVLIAARAMKRSLAILTPAMAAEGLEAAGRVVIGTVKGDLHDIGKNLVASMLEGGGFEVVDLGVDVSPEKFVEAAQQKDGTIVALSALLTTTMTMMKTVIEALEAAGVRQSTKVIIGGAPITQRYADEIGADGFSDNASAAVALARKLVEA